MFSVRFTIGLLLFLLIPFYIRFKYHSIEPFPAVLMPVGAYTIRQDSARVAVTYTALYGVAKNGTWQKLDPQLFIYPIPLQYLTYVTENNFGLRRDSVQSGTNLLRLLKKMHWLTVRRKTAVDTAEVKMWLRQKLEAQGVIATELKTVAIADTISLKTNTSVSKKILYEKTIPLDQ